MTTVNLNIEKFLGINESPDGDSGLKMGEAAEMYNFRITEEGNLKKMRGYSLVTSDEGAEDIDGMIWWDDLLIFVTDGKVFTWDGTDQTELTFFPELSLTAGKVTLFVFDDKLYFLNGSQYLYWGGGTEYIKNVAGYVPTVLIASTPASGAGTLYEAINQLTAKRIQNFNGDNSAVAYKIGETNIASVDKVIVNDQLQILTTHYTVASSGGYTTVTFGTAPTEGLDNVSIEYTAGTSTTTDRFTSIDNCVTYYLSGKNITSITSVTVDGSATTAYTADLVNGTITFTSAPTGAKPIVVVWRQSAKWPLNARARGMKYVQFFGGENNTRAFFYGDGTSTVFYSEPIDGATKASVEYFPELNRLDVDLDSVPVTALVPYYDRLFIFKEDSIYYCRYSTFTGDNGAVIISFPTTNVTKSVGCTVYNGAINIPSGIVFPAADGVYLAAGGAVYEQMSESLISKKVDKSYKLLNQSNMLTLNNVELGECWFIDGNDIIVYNYRNKTWYKLDILEDALSVLYVDGSIYFGNDAGEVFLLDDTLSYNGEDIDAYWESGSMDFGTFNQKKWIDRIWITLKSEANSSVTLDLESDVTSNYPERDIAHGRATFASVNFANFSFNTNDKPASKMMRIKAKKFAFLKVILKNDSSTDACTVMNMKAPVTVGGITK